MNWRTEWRAISHRISGFSESVTVFLRALGVENTDPYSMKKKHLLPAARSVFSTLEEFADDFGSALPLTAHEALRRFLAENESLLTNEDLDNLGIVIASVVALHGFKVEFVTINTLSRIGGKGKLRPMLAGVHTLALMLRLIMLFNPLKVFLPISGIIFTAGIGFIAVNFFLGAYHIPASAVISISVSFLILCLALLAEQISILAKKRQG